MEPTVTDRYAKAIEQFGSDKLDVRIGGIYALERVAHDSPRDHPTIMEVLAAFIREHSEWLKRDLTRAPAGGPDPDVQAALTVIGRRNREHDRQPINLQGTYLNRADLAGANLTGANLRHAYLNRADLAGANLTGTNLIGAGLGGANLTGANLTGANLRHAGLLGANLTGAGLGGADLREANLRHVYLAGADLTGTIWPADEAVPEGWQQDARSRRLSTAGTDSGPAAPTTSDLAVVCWLVPRGENQIRPAAGPVQPKPARFFENRETEGCMPRMSVLEARVSTVAGRRGGCREDNLPHSGSHDTRYSQVRTVLEWAITPGYLRKCVRMRSSATSPRPIEGRMTSVDDASTRGAAPADHAGSILCRLLISHPEVVDIEILGQLDLPDGVIIYSLGVKLPDGRELLIDVGDV